MPLGAGTRLGVYEIRGPLGAGSAALNHPNVLAVCDVGTHESLPHIVSERLEGDTLRTQIRDGYVKILDFGLAKLRGDAASGPEHETATLETRPGGLSADAPGVGSTRSRR